MLTKFVVVIIIIVIIAVFTVVVVVVIVITIACIDEEAMLATTVPVDCQQSFPCGNLLVESVSTADEEHEETNLLPGIARAR